MIFRPATARDFPRLAALRQALWPDGDAAELAAELAALLADPGRSAIFVAEAGDGALAGFAEVGIRPYAEGCAGPAGYLEGIYVAPAHRRRGVALALLAAAEAWARQRGVADFASDALLDNAVSHAWHAAAGFAKVERLVAFRKPLR